MMKHWIRFFCLSLLSIVTGIASAQDVEISTVEQLKEFRDAVNSGNQYTGKTVKLTADLDLSGESNWTPIGNLVAYPGQSFNGTFDGDGHSISNVTVNDNTPNYAVAGLFGSVVNGTIKNLTVKNVNITSTHWAGGIVAYTSNKPSIENCKVIGGTIKSTPEIVDGSYDNGDKAGGIMGQATAGSTINNCYVEKVTITAYRDFGGIIGCSAGTVSNNTVKDITLTQDLTHNYKGTVPTTFDYIMGRDEGATLINNTVIKSDPVAQIGETKYEKLAEAVAAANAGDVIKIIKAGDYKLPNLPKNVTIEGTVDGVIFKDIVANPTNENNIASIPNGATFKNVSFEVGNINYHGFTHAGTINMEGCTLNGRLTSYADMNFTNCEFVHSGDYNMWVYGQGNVLYDGCTFTNNTKGKMLHLYCEDANQTHKVTVKNCKFVNKGELSKSAINVKATSGSNALQYELHLEGNNTYEGSFPTAVGEQDNSDHTWILSPLAQVDDRSVSPDNIKVFENDVLIYPVSYVAQIGDVKYETLAEAVAAAKSGDTIKLLVDLENTGNVSLPAGVTLDGDGKDITGTSAVYINKDGGTVQNVNFKNIHNETSKLSAIYGGNLAGTATITGCTFDNCDWDAIQITPVAGANVVITNNMFSDDVTDNVKQQRYIHVQSKQNVDFSATITENVMPGKLTQEPIGVYYPTDKAKIDLTKNYIESINDVCILVADNNGYAGELVFPAYTTAEKQETYSPVAMIQNGNYAANFYTTLQAAVDAAEAGATIEILKDFTLTTVTNSPSNKYNVNVNKSVTINGDGHTITSSEGKRALALTGDGNNITLKNLTVVNNKSDWCVGILNNPTVTLDATTIDGTGYQGEYNQPLTIGGSGAGGVKLNVTNGSVIKTNDEGTAHYSIIAWRPAEITVTDSELKGWAAIYFKPAATGSTATVENSTLTSKNPYSGNSNSFGVFAIEATNVTVDVTNSTIDIDGVSNKQAIVNYGTTYGDCTGSMVNIGDGNKVTLKNQATFTINQGDTYKLQVSGGLFSEQVPEENCAEGIIPTANTDAATSATYPYTVKEGSYVAQIEGGAKYESLEAAFAAAVDGNTVTLLKDVEITDRLFVNAGTTPEYNGTDKRFATTTENKSITLDLSGYNVTTSSNIALAGGSLNIVNNGTADAEHGVISTSGSGLAPIEIRGTGDLTAKRTLTIGENVTLKGVDYGLNVFGSNDDKKNDIEVNVNGKVEGTLFVLGNLKNTENNVVVNVNGSVTEATAAGISLNGFATVNVAESATVEGAKLGIEVRAGNLNVAGGTITSKAEEYTVSSNGSGSAATGAAISVAQHTTGLPINANITGCKLSGVKSISVADPENKNLEGVTVKVADALAKAETVVIPAGYKWVSSEGVSTLTPCDYVAQVGETQYETLADAFAAAADGNTVTLLKDVALTDRLFINAGSTPAYAGSNNRYATTSENKSITLDLNGNNVTSSSNIALAGGSLNIVNNGTADAEHGVISTTNDGLAPIEIRGTGDLTQKRTMTVGTGVTLSGAVYGLNIFGSNDAQKNVIDVNVNGTVNGTLFVLGNLKNAENEININVAGTVYVPDNGDDEASVGVALNGIATVNVNEGAQVSGETGIEVRAGNLVVNGGNITATASTYSEKKNGSGSCTEGAAVAVAQHTTKLPITATLNGGTLTGTKTLVVTDVEEIGLNDVTVKAADALANAETVIIPAAYKWVSDGTMSTLTPRDPVAKIDETVYYSLADAVAAVPTDGTEKTITLLADVTENVAVSGGKNIVLGLGEKTLTGYIDLYDSELNVKNGNVAGTVYVNGGPASAKAGYNKFTLAEDATINADWGFILYQGPNGNDAYGSVIDINGTVNGTAWVMGNITEGNSVINVNNGAKIQGEVFGLNGLATLNVKEGATIIGSETGIEVRAGNLNVEGGTITSTATEYKVESNGSGTTTTGAAIAVAQHTTKLPISTNITGCTLTGVKTISVADPENGNLAGVIVKVADALANAETVIIPAAYKWVSDGTMSTLTPRDPVAKIDETVYYSLADAVAAVPTDGTEKTITLLADVTENVAVSGGKNIVLDLGEKTLTGYIDLYDSELNVKNGNVAGTVYVNGGPASAEAGYNKFTLAADATITADWGFMLYQGPNGNDAYGSVIDINGTVNGTAWVMGNITEGNSVINVNNGAKIEGSVFGLNGYATLNVNEGATIIGSETGIEVRAGKLNVMGGTITSTASEYTVVPNGSGTTTTGVAIAVAQHTTGLATEVKISGGEFAGVKSLAIVNPQNNTAENVKVVVSGGKFNGNLEVSDTRVTKFVSGGIYSQEPDEKYCVEGYVVTDNTDEATKAQYPFAVKTKEEAGIYELIDGTPYPESLRANGGHAKEVTYTHKFAGAVYSCWWVPFNYTISDEDAAKFDFYTIHMIAGAKAAGEIEETGKIWIYLSKQKSGKLLKAGHIYVIKPTEAINSYTFKATDVDLLSENSTTSRKHTETSDYAYDFYGTYVGYETTKPNDVMWLSKSGTIDWNLSSGAKLGSYRWFIRVTSKTGSDDADAKITIGFKEDEGDTDGINNAQASEGQIQGIYTLGGMKVEHPIKGVNIIKYTDGRTKKINVK